VVQRVPVCGEGGSSLLWAIGALVLLSVLGATVALMSPSALQSKLEQEAGMRAYYNANAGLNYILGMQQAKSLSNVSFANFKTDMGDGAYANCNIGRNDGFYFKLGNFVTANSNSTYQITDLVGTVANSSGEKIYSYVLYGGGKGSSSVLTYGREPSGATKYVVYAGNAKVSIDGAAVITGDVYAKSLDVQMVVITGSVSTVNDAKLGFATTLKGSLCSGGNVTLDQSSVSQTINAMGDIDFEWASQVGGDVFSGGNITTASSVRLYSNVNAQESVSLGWDTRISKNTYAGGVGCKKCDIDFDGTSASIGNNAYANKNIDLSWGSSISGVAVAQKVNIVPGSSVGSYQETTSYPPNVRPTAPAACRNDSPPNMTKFNNTSTVDIDIPWASSRYDKNNPLKPGKYRDLRMGSSATLTFTAGEYYFNSVTTGWDDNINYDLSGGDITIFVTGDIYINRANSISISSNGKYYKDISDTDPALAAKVYWESHKAGTIEWGTDWFGTMFTQDSITLGGANIHVVGALVTSGTVSDIDWAASIYYVPSNYAKANWY
jgi:hypothetical protein